MPRKLVPSVVSRLIEDIFPYVRDKQQNPQLSSDNAGPVRGILDAIDAIPDELISLSGNDFARFLHAVGRMRMACETWTARGATGTLPGFFLRDAHELLQNCPDAVPAPGTAELAFVSDADLRHELRKDISWAAEALRNGDWKAATVLSGALAEALLHWSLGQPGVNAGTAAVALQAARVFSQAAPSDINYWTLYHYVEVAAHLGLVTAPTAAQLRLAKDFRNLIHPGKATRLGQACDQGTAHAAFAAVQMVARDLSAP